MRSEALRSLLRAVCVGALAMSFERGALAAPEDGKNVEGTVLSLEGGDVIVDLGAPRGLAEGDLLELWRAIELVHPVTHKPVRDRYRIGFLKVVQVRDRLAVAVVQGTAKREPHAGDTVVLRRTPEKPAAVAGPPEKATMKVAAAGPTDEDAARVSQLFDSVKGAGLEARIRAYVEFIRKNPKSPYAPILREDAVQYHRLLRAEAEEAGTRTRAEAPLPPASAPERATVTVVTNRTPEITVTDFDPPAHALPARPFSVGLRISGTASGLVLHVRAPGEVGYRPLPMTAAGSGHYTVTIPADRMRPPQIEYFVERVDAEGRATSLVGTEDEPLKVEVEKDIAATREILQRSTTASALVDFADYNTLKGETNDRTFQTEGQLGMRFGDIGVRALRTGFGVFRGVGGSLQELDELHLEPRKVGLTYGYLEGEFGFIKRASLVVRGVCGLTEEGVAVGVMAFVRIGSDQETNLALGGEFLGGIGARSITQLEIREIPRVPILLRGEVSNQPAGTLTGARSGSSQLEGDLGVRSIVQVGYELFPGFVFALRGSAQGRTIYHYGFGGGGAVSYSW